MTGVRDGLDTASRRSTGSGDVEKSAEDGLRLRPDLLRRLDSVHPPQHVPARRRSTPVRHGDDHDSASPPERGSHHRPHRGIRVRTTVLANRKLETSSATPGSRVGRGTESRRVDQDDGPVSVYGADQASGKEPI